MSIEHDIEFSIDCGSDSRVFSEFEVGLFGMTSQGRGDDRELILVKLSGQLFHPDGPAPSFACSQGIFVGGKIPFELGVEVFISCNPSGNGLGVLESRVQDHVAGHASHLFETCIRGLKTSQGDRVLIVELNTNVPYYSQPSITLVADKAHQDGHQAIPQD